MERVKFNVNDYVWITLTDKGRAALLDHWRLSHNRPMEAEKACDTCHPGWRESNPLRMQLWNVMSYFGGVMGNGLEVPFETNLEFEVGS